MTESSQTAPLPPPVKPKPTLRSRILVPIGALLLAAIIVEILVRVVPFYPASFITGDPVLGWRYAANASGTWFNVGCPREFTNTVVINSQGWHDIEHAPEPPREADRVVILGDSLVGALEVPVEQSFWRLMQQGFDAAGQSVEVRALGVTGYGTAQSWLNYQQYGEPLRPRAVILVFTPHNDFYDNHPAFDGLAVDWFYTRPYFTLNEDEELVAIPSQAASMPPVHRLLLQNSALYRLLSVRLRNFMPPVTIGGDDAVAARDESWRITFALVAALRDTVEALGAQFGVVIDQSAIATLPERRTMHDLILESLGARDINVLSLLDSFEAAQATGTPVRYSCDSHWTPAGHVLAAEQTIPFVQGLLAAPES